MHTTESHSPRSIRRTIAAAAIGLLAFGGLAACGASTPAGKASTKKATVKSVATTSSVAPTSTGSGSNGANGNAGNSGNSNSGGQASGGATGNGNGGATTGTPPTIYSFTTPDNIDCHNGNLQNFTASWTTQNATKVTISIDGPGVYNTYGPNDSTSLPFNCSSSHTFLLTAFSAGGKTTTKSITLQPRNVQTTSSDDTTTTQP